MKKVVLLAVSLFLFTSCADIFCNIVNNWDARKEAKNDKEGAGKLPYAVTKDEVNMYVISKSGWDEVYWPAPHHYAEYSDWLYRPHFWQMEAMVTPYPSSDNPLVYIVQYPQIVIDSTTHLTKWGNKDIEAALAAKEHCASWEVISSDKRLAPVLIAGEGGFPYKRPIVMALLNDYCSELKILQSNMDTLGNHSARIAFWSGIKASGGRVYYERMHNYPSSYDPGYKYPLGFYWDTPSFWLPLWKDSILDNGIEAGGGGSDTFAGGAHFYPLYNSFDNSNWGTPLDNPASFIMNKYPVGGYKHGRYVRLSYTADVNYQVREDVVTFITYYCLLPEKTGSLYPIWCQNPEDWK